MCNKTLKKIHTTGYTVYEYLIMIDVTIDPSSTVYHTWYYLGIIYMDKGN